MAEWHTLESARDQWVDAPLDDDQLSDLLAVAKDAVLAYAPVDDDLDPEDPDTIPDGYRVAQLLQTKNVWNSGYATPSGDLDGSAYGLTTFPLDWQVKQLLRPRTVFGGPVG